MVQSIANNWSFFIKNVIVAITIISIVINIVTIQRRSLVRNLILVCPLATTLSPKFSTVSLRVKNSKKTMISSQAPFSMSRLFRLTSTIGNHIATHQCTVPHNCVARECESRQKSYPLIQWNFLSGMFPHIFPLVVFNTKSIISLHPWYNIGGSV